MDYSAISHDPDHPSGSDPWASPRATQTSYPASNNNNDIPSSPLPPHQQPGYNGDQEGDEPRPRSSENGVPDSPDLSERLQSAQLGDPDYAVEQPPYATQAHYANEPRSQLPARYQTGARQNARPGPAYKIQAKITGLERTGKKDPILRFDVHVSRVLVALCSPAVEQTDAGN